MIDSNNLPLPDDDWTLPIQPQRHLLDLRLGELWQYRDLVLLFVRRDFVAVYKQTVLGPLDKTRSTLENTKRISSSAAGLHRIVMM